MLKSYFLTAVVNNLSGKLLKLVQPDVRFLS